MYTTSPLIVHIAVLNKCMLRIYIHEYIMQSRIVMTIHYFVKLWININSKFKIIIKENTEQIVKISF